MIKSDVKDQILHSLGTMTAIELVFNHRLDAYDDPTGEQVRAVLKTTLSEFADGFISQIKESS